MVRLVTLIVSLSRAQIKGAMRKGSIYNLRALDFATLERIEIIRTSARASLENSSILGTPHLDHDRAAEILCACAVEDGKVRLAFYRNLPDFIEYWKIEISERAVICILGCFPNFKFEVTYQPLFDKQRKGQKYEDPRQFMDEMVNAVMSELYSSEPVALEQGGEALQGDLIPTLRKALFKVYQERFPEASIREICWAAHQHVREWQRWMKGELPKGSKADRLFRAVLLGSKSPKEIRPEPRPKDYKEMSVLSPYFHNHSPHILHSIYSV
jgi:hypothetical protein